MEIFIMKQKFDNAHCEMNVYIELLISFYYFFYFTSDFYFVLIFFFHDFELFLWLWFPWKQNVRV